MRYRCIDFRQDEGVGVIMLNRPEAGNRINRQLASELVEICAKVNESDRIRVIIVTGAGTESFCLGSDADIRRWLMKDLSIGLCPVTEAIAGIKIPVIAALNGDAFEMGLEIAIACDIRVAADNARFCMSQILSASIPCCGGSQRLPRIVGKAKALEMILTGEVINAAEALKWGLVSKVVPAQELNETVWRLARSMASKAPIATCFVKEAICAGFDLTLEQGLRLESDLYFLLHTTEDRREGIKSFLEKRLPRFESK